MNLRGDWNISNQASEALLSTVPSMTVMPSTLNFTGVGDTKQYWEECLKFLFDKDAKYKSLEDKEDFGVTWKTLFDQERWTFKDKLQTGFLELED